jgi:hypothetical protein
LFRQVFAFYSPSGATGFGESPTVYGSISDGTAGDADSVTNVGAQHIVNDNGGSFPESWALGGNFSHRADHCCRFLAFVRVPTATTSAFWLFGLTKFDSTSGGTHFYAGELQAGALALGIAFTLDAGTGNWFVVTNDGVTPASYDTLVPWSDRQFLLEFRIDITNGGVEAWIDNVLVASITTNLPAVSDPLYINVGGYKAGVANTTTGLYISDLKLWERLPV